MPVELEQSLESDADEVVLEFDSRRPFEFPNFDPVRNGDSTPDSVGFRTRS